MGRNVYFSFHYQDVQDGRANIVMKSSQFGKKRDEFRDASIKEEAEEKKVKTLKKLIDNELVGTSVTCVLIGSETYSRRFVRYEIMKSFEMKKGLLGVGINWVKDLRGNTKLLPGENPFEYLAFKISSDGRTMELYEKKDGSWQTYRDLPAIKNAHFKDEYFGRDYRLSNFYNTWSYDWNNGKSNFSDWVETAAARAGR